MVFGEGACKAWTVIFPLWDVWQRWKTNFINLRTITWFINTEQFLLSLLPMALHTHILHKHPYLLFKVEVTVPIINRLCSDSRFMVLSIGVLFYAMLSSWNMFSNRLNLICQQLHPYTGLAYTLSIKIALSYSFAKYFSSGACEPLSHHQLHKFLNLHLLRYDQQTWVWLNEISVWITDWHCLHMGVHIRTNRHHRWPLFKWKTLQKVGWITESKWRYTR